ncbi:MAG TPA: DNA polymerase IV [Jiangellaceae bacterium]|nr:DNA polymerase IV [Jiangellaceae bacterium]
MQNLARTEPNVLHVDLDAFFAAVEQRDKPSLRGRPVIVGGLGPRGVVSTASYEARKFGVRSAMSMAEARSRCSHAAFLAGRFRAYRAASEIVMATLRELSPVIEPLSLDEAFVDLAARAGHDLSPAGVRTLGERLRATIHDRTALTASVGAATSKLLAKIASEQAKPDGLLVVEPGTELSVLHPLPVRALPGIGPATAERLARLGVRTVGDLAAVTVEELVGLLGEAHGRSLYRLARAQDDRPVSPERETKSVSIEDTFDQDITDRDLLTALIGRMATKVAGRLRESGQSGRTVTLKVRLHDFTTLSRSATLPGPTDDERVVRRVAAHLLDEIDTTGGIRLLGVGLAGLADWVQEDLFANDDRREEGERAGEHTSSTSDLDAGASTPDWSESVGPDPAVLVHSSQRWIPGMDVRHAEYGPGWVWGAGLGRVTVRFETAESGPGPVRTFADDDPALTADVDQKP